MKTSFKRSAVIGTAVACGLTLAGGGAALAVSGGGYSPQNQDCSPNADAITPPQAAQPGCHDFKVNVTDGHGKRYAEVGLDQLPNGPSIGALAGVATPGSPNFPHAGCVSANTNGTNGGAGQNCGSNPNGLGAAAVFDTQNPGRNKVTPSTGAPDVSAIVSSAMSGFNVYLGADDNLDAGEHDGVNGLYGTKKSVNGPSDGGAVSAHVSPQAATTKPSLTNPVPVAGASEGACADGFCEETTTQRQAVYHGGTKGSREVSDYQSKQWDPYNCSSGDVASEKACQTAQQPNMDAWKKSEAQNVYAEPGVQVYEDPDPQASPIDPIYEAGLSPTNQPILYPIPGVYAGTCGVVAGGGPVLSAPANTPITNHAGQVAVSTGC